MKWFTDQSMQNKFLIIITCLAVTSALAIGWNVRAFIRLGNDMDDLFQDTLKLSDLNHNKAKFLEMEKDFRSFLLTDDVYYLTGYEVGDEEINLELFEALLKAERLDEKNDLSMLSGIKQNFDLVLSNKLVRQEEYSIVQDPVQWIEEMDNEAWAYIDLLDNMTGKTKQLVLEQQAEISWQIKKILMVDIAVLLFMVFLVVLAAIVANQISEPLLYLTNAVIAFENNAYDPHLISIYAKEDHEMGRLVRAFDEMVTTITESSQQKDQFLDATSRFVPSAYLDFLEKKSIVDVRLGDHVSAEMAVLFSDIRSFTRLSEGMSAQENFEFVNEYLKLVSPSIEENNGFIVKYLGDGMMAVFPYSADDAVQAAIEKKIMVRRFNALRISNHRAPITIGIGIHTGHMMVGIIGEERRMQGDAFSDHVNLTSRVESLTRFFDVSMLVTEEALMRLENKGLYHHRFMGRIRLHGKEHPLSLYEIFDGDDDDTFRLKQTTRKNFLEGMGNYLKGEFSMAEQCFHSVLQINDTDQAARFYLEKSREYGKNQVTDDWDGVVTMSQK